MRRCSAIRRGPLSEAYNVSRISAWANAYRVGAPGSSSDDPYEYAWYSEQKSSNAKVGVLLFKPIVHRQVVWERFRCGLPKNIHLLLDCPKRSQFRFIIQTLRCHPRGGTFEKTANLDAIPYFIESEPSGNKTARRIRLE